MTDLHEQLDAIPPTPSPAMLSDERLRQFAGYYNSRLPNWPENPIGRLSEIGVALDELIARRAERDAERERFNLLSTRLASTEAHRDQLYLRAMNQLTHIKGLEAALARAKGELGDVRAIDGPIMARDSQIDDLTRERDAARAEVERLNTWDGLLSTLDGHWPESIFPTKPDDPKRDEGPRIASLIRWVQKERARADHAEAELAKRRQESIDEIAQKDRWWNECRPYLDAACEGMTWAWIIKHFATKAKDAEAELARVRGVQNEAAVRELEALRDQVFTDERHFDTEATHIHSEMVKKRIAALTAPQPTTGATALPGPCVSRSPAGTHCALRAGHMGMHEEGIGGMAWNDAAAKPPAPSSIDSAAKARAERLQQVLCDIETLGEENMSPSGMPVWGNIKSDFQVIRGALRLLAEESLAKARGEGGVP